MRTDVKDPYKVIICRESSFITDQHILFIITSSTIKQNESNSTHVKAKATRAHMTTVASRIFQRSRQYEPG
jgi:hypothetical protein